MSIGLKMGMVTLEPHQKEWETAGKIICAKIKDILGDDAADVQHIGSTSIRGIYAKPVIDIAVGVNSFQDMMKHDDELAKNGIIYRGQDQPGQHLYRCGNLENEIVTHFIHVVIIGSDSWQNYINFRDYLNCHQDDAQAYSALKTELYTEFSDDRKAYTDAKHNLVAEILDKAKKWRNEQTTERLMSKKHVIVQAYDESWATDFETIKAEISAALGGAALAIEHVGSTSVKGLAAKPVIDIDIVVKDDELPRAIELLAKIGYIHEGNLGIEGREAFHYEGKEHLKKHHLYVCPESSPELKRHIAFRDYLRSHPEAVQEYSAIKIEAAKLFPYDIDSYIAHKSPLIEKIYQEIGL